MRIIAGRWRRRVLRFPDALGLRPTPDRVRETVFNWLGQDLDGPSCLDLFAGSGALGIEALSRGAGEVTLVEREAAVVRALREQAAAIGLAGLRIEQSDALQFASRCRAQARRFDLVFLDPPYRQDWWPKLSPLLDDLVAEDGRAYVEAERRVAPPPGWRAFREGRAGQVFFHLFERESGRAGDPRHGEQATGDLPGDV